MLDVLNLINPNPENRTTEAENKVIVEFLSLPEQKFKHQRFSTLAKKRVLESLKQNHDWDLSRENLNNKIYSLMQKNLITRDEDGVLYFTSTLLRAFATANEALNSKQVFNIVFSFQDAEQETPSTDI